MAVDFVAEALSIKPLIDDELFFQYQGLGAVDQKKFLDQLDENELINIKLRLDKTFYGSDEAFTEAFRSARRDFGAGGTELPSPGFMSGEKIAGSQAQDFAQEIYSGMRENTFDYSGIQNSRLRRGLSFMDTAGEKEAYLTKNIGPENVGWTMDRYGRYAIMPEYRERLGGTPGDKPLTIDNPGVYEAGDWSDLAGSAPEITATILASIASRNYGLIPAVLASAGAAGTAKTFEELAETSMGLQQQSLGEVGTDIAKEAGIGALAELGGRGLVGTGKKLFSPAEVRIPTGEKGMFNFNTYTYAPRVDAASGPGARETQTIVRELLDEGAIPDVAKATNRTILGKVSGMIEEIFGYNQQKNVTNVKYMKDKINGFLTDVGADPFDPFMGKVFPKLGEEELGALIQQQIGKSKSALELGVDNSLKILKDAVKAEEQALAGRVGTGKIPQGAGQQLSDGVADAYANFQAASAKLYNEADQLLGNKAFIPTDALKRQAQAILDDLPKNAEGMPIAGSTDGGVLTLQEIVNMPAYINSTHMSALRTRFSNAGYKEDMLKSVDIRQYNLLKTASNDAFDQALNSGIKMFGYIDKGGNRVLAERALTAQEKQRNTLGLEKLKEATKSYGEGIAVFDNSLIKKLTKVDGVEADRLINTVVTRNEPGKITKLINASADKDATRKMLQSGHFDSMIVKASDADGNVSATVLLKQIKDLGTTFPALYGESAPVIKNALNQLRKVQQFIPKDEAVRIKASLLDALYSGEVGSFKNVVKTYAKNVEEQFKFFDANFAKKVGSFSPEEVMPWLTNTAKSNDITAFINFYKKTNPEVVEQFRQKYMVNLLDNVFESTNVNPVGIVLNGNKLLNAIQTKGGAARLNAAFGSETAQALEKFAEKAAFLTSKSGSMAGSLAANQIALNPLQNIGKLIKLNILGKVIANPTTLRYLTTIIENPNARTTGYAVGQLGADIIAQISAEDSTVDPAQMEKMKLELDNALVGILDNEDEIEDGEIE
tara:strand:+ start:5046 stop:8054 length:3009 start_codon:yes stop_codon:yes gene_type:complete